MMTNAEFEELMAQTFDDLMNLRRLKAGEYAEDGDALANFRRNSVDMGMPMEVVWRVYAGKHWDAISQHVRDAVNGTERVLSEPIEGRINDLIVYLLLFKAIVKERSENGRWRPEKVVPVASTGL